MAWSRSTGMPLHRAIVEDPEFRRGDYTIHWLERFVANRRAHTYSAYLRNGGLAKNEAGEWVDQPGAVQIDRPTQMTETYLTSHRRLVIEERPADPPAAPA